MSDSPDLIGDFEVACDALINSAYILTEQKISRLLKIVASSSILYSYFMSAAKEFNFDKFYEDCRTKLDGHSFSLNPPKDENLFAVFALGLLHKFDTREIDIHAFLNECYASDEGINDSYTQFSHDILTKFKQIVLHEVYSNG